MFMSGLDRRATEATRRWNLSRTRSLYARGEGYHSLWPKRIGKAISGLYERPHWRRMWIIQKVLHAQEITVWCGSKSVPWEALEQLYLKLKRLEETHWLTHLELVSDLPC
ncbi:hypothetical protein GGR57DRAFT_309669 [Xylariaceae sp. FL1272]|nr:hypothetical protein GGR57DRAFT_309669 [Xylariaceae sp. FL1272]